MTDLLPDQDVQQWLSEHDAWRLDERGALRRDVTLDDFAHALLFVNALGFAAERRDHHPDVLVHGYKHVAVTLRSHDVEGITSRDLRLAEDIEQLLEG